ESPAAAGLPGVGKWPAPGGNRRGARVFGRECVQPGVAALAGPLTGALSRRAGLCCRWPGTASVAVEDLHQVIAELGLQRAVYLAERLLENHLIDRAYHLPRSHFAHVTPAL